MPNEDRSQPFAVNEPTGPWAVVSAQIDGLRDDVREDIAACREELGERMHRVESQMAVLVSGYQRQGVQLGEHQAACRERHRRDSAEAKRIDKALDAASKREARLVALETTGVARLNFKQQLLAVLGLLVGIVGAGLAAVRWLVP